ncbi:bifunctional 5,10-methylene-tetrahydrofolate dehydrogenase/5,10-methylene-tetrahydrofolate cyclohydrolase [Lottiidibacillus patelloidae]|uniref:Bifunctional protein FolD n=1 Tax=Lottiidibacillus patelloidae TaxID=2670334 RepID=A0A263BR95_9BACI|nr:tetrahydrofolate dehydrogenase/cyclohydrolase catalytic domain-containing protein [Lottiidibacillus patelloidae]OZM56229.1 bifunctional 5,10-methylene-tetrahydrofolate dehydrogenase/5,10-methylene-tetrahydrofolate cyclohydrolase [Lottiidibacillus patelloidae]
MKNQLILDGKKVANHIKELLSSRINKLGEKGITPCLATILVGDDPASETYVRMKGNACKKLGLESLKVHLPSNITTEDLIALIHKLNRDEKVHGILLQHPVPSHIDERLAFDAIALEKDVDGVTTNGFGQTAFQLGTFPSCTPAAILEMIDYYNLNLEGKNTVVVGRSPILGKPVAMMLLNRNATVTICHSKTKQLEDIVSKADIVVAAVGKPHFIKGDWIKEGAVIIDAGYNKGNVGDVDFIQCKVRASAITPVPAGVGPVTIAMLLKHTVIAAETQTRNLIGITI